MDRKLLYALAFFSLIVFGFLAYTRAQAPPEGVLIEGNTARVKASAAYNMWGEDGNGNGVKEYRLTEPIPAELTAWLEGHGYKRAGFEPYAENGVADSLGLYPLFVGYVLYNKQE